MTKVIILGEQKEKTNKKPIEFVSFLNDKMELVIATKYRSPNKYKNIELISRKYSDDGLDLMFAYDDDRNDEHSATLFVGHFNDGVV